MHLQMWKRFDDKSIQTIKIQESFLKLLLRGHLYLWQPLKMSLYSFSMSRQIMKHVSFHPLLVFSAIL